MTEPVLQSKFEGGLAYLQIDYPAGTDDPARIFRAMARLIDAVHQVDRDLARSVAADIEPVLILERVEAGSLRAWLRTAIRQLDDDALKTLDWKPLIGQYLVKAKHRVLRWLDDKNVVHSRDEIIELQKELMALVPIDATDALLVEPIPPLRLLEGIRLITEAAEELRDTDRVTYVSEGEETQLDTSLHLSAEDVEELLTDEVITSASRLLLLVKKPDYLGNSRWEFRLDDRTVEARILDDAWLERFRGGHVVLRPGDALDATVRSEVYRGFEGNIVGTRYFVDMVFGTVQAPADSQGDLDFRS